MLLQYRSSRKNAAMIKQYVYVFAYYCLINFDSIKFAFVPGKARRLGKQDENEAQGIVAVTL